MTSRQRPRWPRRPCRPLCPLCPRLRWRRQRRRCGRRRRWRLGGRHWRAWCLLRRWLARRRARRCRRRAGGTPPALGTGNGDGWHGPDGRHRQHGDAAATPPSMEAQSPKAQGAWIFKRTKHATNSGFVVRSDLTCLSRRWYTFRFWYWTVGVVGQLSAVHATSRPQQRRDQPTAQIQQNKFEADYTLRHSSNCLPLQNRNLFYSHCACLSLFKNFLYFSFNNNEKIR